MSGLFFIGDTHFGHHKIAVLRGFGSVQEHDEYLIEQWNATVRKRDTVWHLGDVLFGKHSFACLERLNGTKKLECELTLKDGRPVWDLNGLTAMDWEKLPPRRRR